MFTPTFTSTCTSTMSTLDKLRTGNRAQIKAVSCNEPSLYFKLLSMGIVPGARVEVARVAPLGDPIAVRTSGHDLSLRLSEAKTVEIEFA